MSYLTQHHNNHSGSLSKPAAMLVVYNKGFKFKYNKYYLRLGDNQIGTHPSCTVNLPSGDGIPSRACVISITSEMATITPVEPHCLFVPSNMLKKNLLVEVPPGTRYVIEMEKDFSICGLKVIMQVSELSELLQIKGVSNQAKFDLRRREEQEGSDHTEQMKSNHGGDQFQPTMVLDDGQDIEPTLPLNDTFQPTMRLDDDDIYGATLALDQSEYFLQPQRPPSHKKQAVVQNKVSSSIPNSPAQNTPIMHSQQSQVSMPATVRQEEMPQTIQDDQMPQTIRESQDVFPPTIQEPSSSTNKMQQIRNKIAFGISKSIPIHQQNQQIKANKHQSTKVQGKYYSSYPESKDEEKPDKDIEDFDDLFGGGDDLLSSAKKVNSLKSSSFHRDLDPVDKPREDPQLSQIAQISQKNEQSQRPPLKKYLCLDHRLTAQQKQRLLEKGYEATSEQNIEGFDLLLVGPELKLSTTLLLALIEGKEIQHVGWVSNPSTRITGKLEGFPWQSIYKRKGKKNTIFDSTQSYYLQQQIRQEYGEIMTRAGATLTDNIGKNKSRSIISIILDPKTRAGRQLYEDKKNYKKWSFFSKKMILESVLMGEEIKEKHRIDSYSF